MAAWPPHTLATRAEDTMAEQDVATAQDRWDRCLAAERDRARRLRAVTSALSTAALGLAVSPALSWVQSTDEHEGFDPNRTLQLDESGPWRADGWFLLRDALGDLGREGSAATVVLMAAPLLAAAAAAWAMVRQDRGAAVVARFVGAAAVLVLLVLGLRFLDGAGVDLGAGYWLAVVLCGVLTAAGVALGRALRPADLTDA
jgi:hypothetical protein